MTRKKITALTLIETLSRVITSWGGTSMATVRRLTLADLVDERHQQDQARARCRPRPG